MDTTLLSEPRTELQSALSVLAEVPDPEVMAKAKRRQFTAEYKRCILKEAEGCKTAGEVGALLRREGLYSSHLTTWRRQGERGELSGLAPRKRGKPPDPHAAELAQLRQENEQLQAQVERLETVLEVQKKLLQVLGLDKPSPAAASRRGDNGRS